MSILRYIVFIFMIASLSGACLADDEEIYTLERDRMVEGQLKARDITEKSVLAAMTKVRRHLFVPAHLRFAAYKDAPLPIGHGQTISQPYIVAYMTQAGGIGPDDRILEIGTGSGYQAAILAELAKEVYTIEILEPLAIDARSRLEEMGYNNIKVKWGDGYRGWKEYAPFDAIIVTAAPDEIPEELVGQLKVGGRMVIPVGSFFQELYLITRKPSGYDKKALMPVRFVPMVRN